MEEMLDIVNEEDEVEGKAPRSEVNAKGLMHRCAAMYLERKGKIALQKRSAEKKIRPGHWSIMEETLQSGETYKQAAIRGTREEYGVQAQTIRLIGKTIIRDPAYNDNFHLWVYRCTAFGEIRPQRGEVEKVRFYMPNQVKAMIKSEKASPGLVQTLEFFLKSQKT